MKLLFVGDVMLGRLVNQALKTQPPEYPWGDTLPFFNQADLSFCNLESVVSDIGQPCLPAGRAWSATPKAFHFRSDAKNIEVLKAAQIKAVSLANNHVLDFEYEAMFEMLKLLTSAEIAFAGAGATFTVASKPAFLKFNQQKLGFIAFTDNEPQWESADLVPGIFYVPVNRKDRRAQQLAEIIRHAKKESDILVVSAHWGPNWGYAPPAEHPSFAHFLVDQGADIVFGHSAHVFRGIEIYRNKVIFYSTGNFIDDYAVDEIERNDQSFVFIIETKEDKIARLELYPTIIQNFQAQMAVGDEAEDIALKMQTLSAELGTPLEWQEKEKQLTFSLL